MIVMYAVGIFLLGIIPYACIAVGSKSEKRFRSMVQ